MQSGQNPDHIQVDRLSFLHGHVGHTNKTIMSILEITLEDGSVLSSRSVTYDIAGEDSQ